MLMPSHAKFVHHYKDTVPLFQRMHIEAQLDSMFSPTVTLKSGGYIVINQTEALVSIDVNSGRATREHSIEETARKTNLEAASEIGRQLRLRDLAGLIVIDFIDMEESRNDREVEKRLRDAVKNDRARVQIGKISQFGLMEMSRQRLRAGVIAGSTVTCPHCAGMGLVRSIEIHRPARAARTGGGSREEPRRRRHRSRSPMMWRSTFSTRSATNWRASKPNTAWKSPSCRQGRSCGGKFRTGTHQEPRSGRAPAQCRGQHRSWLCAFQRARAGL